MNVGSLFSGIGGIELGFESEGFKTVWFIENNSYCQAVLKKRFPETPVYGDITKIDFRKLPKVDVLTGGFPCQDISNAGKRVGIEGSRSGLWKYYLKAIVQLRPRIAFIENVAALLSRGLSTVLCNLAKIRYDAEWHCISASSVGAPHCRDRVFILAYPCGNGFSEYNSIQERQQHNGRGKTQRIINTHGTLHANVSNTYKQRPKRARQTEMGFKELWSGGWWAVEPKLGRVANGIPNRVDRIKCLGNAVVPQCSQIFAKAIKEVYGFAQR